MKYAPLGNLVTFVGGGTPARKNDTYWNGRIPWATVKDLNSIELTHTQESISEAGLRSSAAQLIPSQSIIIATRMGLGKVAINLIPVAINQDLKAITVNGKIDRRYLLRFIQFIAPRIERAGEGATVKGVTLDWLRNIEVPLPVLDEQRRIAAILDQADALRRKQQTALALLVMLEKSTFLEMFGDLIAHQNGFAKNTVPLGEIADIVSGITIGRKLNGTPTRKLPYLAVLNVQDHALNLNVIKEVDATNDEFQRYKLRKNDLLLTEGGDPDKLGRGALWNNEIDECIHQNHVFRVRLHSKAIEPLYLNWLVGSAYGKRYFFRSAKQTTGIASINKKELSRFPVVSPPLEMQRKFALIIAAIDQEISRYTAHVTKFNALFRVLQHYAFADTTSLSVNRAIEVCTSAAD